MGPAGGHLTSVLLATGSLGDITIPRGGDPIPAGGFDTQVEIVAMRKSRRLHFLAADPVWMASQQQLAKVG